MTKLPDEAIEKATKQYAWSGRMSDALKAAYPAIEQQIMEQVAADIWEYWPFRRTAHYRIRRISKLARP